MLVYFTANILCMLCFPGDNCGIVKYTDEINGLRFFGGGGGGVGGGKAVATSKALSMVPYN